MQHQAAAPLKTFIVEDSAVIRLNLVNTLQELAPVKVVGAVATQREALHKLTDASLQCDLVIVDIVLQDGTGFAVLAEPAVHRDAREFVVLTNYASPAVQRRCAERECDEDGLARQHRSDSTAARESGSMAPPFDRYALALRLLAGCRKPAPARYCDVDLSGV